MALQIYSSSAVYIGGSLLTENASVAISRRTGAQNVFTVAKGWAGQSPGSRMMEITITEAVPSTSFEFDPGSNMKGLIPVPVAIFAAGKTLTTTGFIDSDDFRHAVNQEAIVDMKISCQFAE